MSDWGFTRLVASVVMLTVPFLGGQASACQSSFEGGVVWGEDLFFNQLGANGLCGGYNTGSSSTGDPGSAGIALIIIALAGIGILLIRASMQGRKELSLNPTDARVLPKVSIRIAFFLLGICGLLAGCARYGPQPLPVMPDLIPPVRLTVSSDRFACPPLKPHPFDAKNGADMVAIAGFAVLNNPDLKAVRRKVGVARAQLFAARLLPDPQISMKLDIPVWAPAPTVVGYQVGPNFDLGYFVTRRAGIDAAAAAVRQVDLDILWQEWQVVQQARILFVRSIYLERKLALLKQIQSLYARRYAISSKALRRGNLTLDVAGTDLTAKIDSETLVKDLEQLLDQTRHQLNAILGIWPDAKVTLVPPGPPPKSIEKQDLNEAEMGMPQRRPDLLALRAGYQSQEAKVYNAVLGQFPALTVGVNYAVGTDDTHTVGQQAALTLPFFNRNRGNIAVQSATREQLRQEYQARIDQANQDVELLWAKQRLLLRQLDQLQADIPTLARMVDEARRAYADHNIGPLIYLNMENTLANKRLKAIDVIQLLWETAIALDTLLARPVTPHMRDGR